MPVIVPPLISRTVNFGYADEECPHCPHPKHEGVCGVMVPTLVSDRTFGKASIVGQIACQCRVEPPIPDSWREGWIRTASGIKFFWNNPTPDMVEIKDIAHHLAQKPRFSGACRYLYSVAMHSLVVASAVESVYRNPWLTLHALLHDCSEYILPDIPSPMKPRIPWWHEAEDRIEAVVAEKFGLDQKLFHDRRIKDIDWGVLNEEGNLLVPGWEYEEYSGRQDYMRLDIYLSQVRDWESVKSQFVRIFLDLKGVLEKA